MNSKKIWLIIPLMLVIIFGCEKEEKEQPKGLEQIRAEDGIPVKIETIHIKNFEKYLSYYSIMTGSVESTKGAMVGDKIAKYKVRVGDHVSENQIIVEFPTDNPTLQYSQAKVAYDNSKKLFDRMSELFKAGETSQQNYENVEAQYLVNKRNLEQLDQMLFVRSPISGTIVKLPFREGDYVKPGDGLFTVAQVSKMKTRVWVSENEIAYIKRGMPVFCVWNNHEYPGYISDISLAMDEFRRAFYVEVEFNNPGSVLKSGVTVDVRMKIYTNKNAIAIQRNLVQSDGTNQYVFCENNGVAVKRQVKLGVESGIEVEIVDGLSDGDNIITEGATLVQDGSKINIVK